MKILKLLRRGKEKGKLGTPLNNLMLASYNVRGINKKPKQAYVKQIIAENKISILWLVETRVKVHKASRISRNICPHWNWAFNYDFHNNGRIWVGWNRTFWNLDIHFVSSQVIHCKVQSIASNNTTFLVSFVYGLNSYMDRRALWNDLLPLSPMGSL